MPTTVNVTGQFGTLTTAQSVVCQLYRSVTDQAAEVAAAQCGYLIATFFSGKNGGGSNLGTATVDAPVGVIAVAHAASLSDLLTKTFPPSSTLN